jgi:DNA-binding SARP family transcriptional activator
MTFCKNDQRKYVQVLELDLLGPPQAREGAYQLTFRTQKTLALLVYLAVTNTPQPRAHLAALLWPDRQEERARATLRSTLRLLREALANNPASLSPRAAEHLVHSGRDHLGRESLWLQSASQEDAVALDLQLVQQAANLTAQRPDLSASDRLTLRQQLEIATKRCKGPFLADFSLNDASDFMDWVEQQRAYWQGKIDRVFQSLSSLQIQQGAFAGAVQTAEQWMRSNPLSEEAHRCLMEAWAATGDYTAALATYMRYHELLARTLKIEPSPEIIALAERLRRASPYAASALPARPEQAPQHGKVQAQRNTPEIPLVGREDEFSALVAAYKRACLGNVQLVHLEGEEGIGKTRLAEEFLHWADGVRGAIILVGRAFETVGRLPYQPLVEALRAQLAQERAPEDLLDDVWLAELSRILPELRERYPDLTIPPGEGSEARGRLFEAVAQLGIALTRQRNASGAVIPLVLFLDDFHWADASARDLLWFVCQRWNEERRSVMVLLAVRQEEVSTSRELREWLHRLHRVVQTTVIIPGTLGEASTYELVRHLFAADTPHIKEIAHWFHIETGGQPLYIAQMLRALLEQGTLAWEEERPGVGWLVSTALDNHALLFRRILPLSMRAVIRQRLERLTPPTSRLLTAAAVLGTRFQPEQAWKLAELDECTGLDILEEAERRLVVRPLANSELYTFTHGKLREVIYAEMGEVRRRVLHRRAFETLEQNNAPAAALAHHAWAARLAEQTFHYSTLAGHAALALFAIRDAIEHYERAWHLLGESTTASKPQSVPWQHPLPEPTEPEREQLSMQLGRAYEWIGALDQASNVYAALRNYAREHNRPALEAAALNRQAAAIWQQSWDFARARALLDEALAAGKMSGDISTVAETAWNQGQIAQWANDFGAAYAHANHALELASSAGLEELTARSLYLIGRIHNVAGEWEQAIKPITKSHEIYAALADKGAQKTAQVMTKISPTSETWELGTHFLWTGSSPMNSLDYRTMEAGCLDLLAFCEINRGQPHAASKLAQQGIEIARATNNAMVRALNLNKLQIALAEVGEYQEVLDIAQEMQELLPATHDPALRWMLLRPLADIQNTLLQLEEARVTLDEAVKLVETIPISHWKNAIYSRLCANRVLASDWPAALAAAQQALTNRETAPANLLWLDFYRHAETEALLHGKNAALAYEDAHRFEKRVGNNRRFQLVYQRVLAALASFEGNRNETIAHLQNALYLAEAIGLPGEQWQIEASLAQCYQVAGQQALALQGFVKTQAIIDSLAAKILDHRFRTQFLSNAQSLIQRKG